MKTLCRFFLVFVGETYFCVFACRTSPPRTRKASNWRATTPIILHRKNPIRGSTLCISLHLWFACLKICLRGHLGMSADERTSPTQGPASNTAIPDGLATRRMPCSGCIWQKNHAPINRTNEVCVYRPCTKPGTFNFLLQALHRLFHPTLSTEASGTCVSSPRQLSW